MATRRRLEGKILTRPEAQTVAKLIRAALGEEIAQTMASLGIDAEATIRFGAVAHRCKTLREHRGLSLKEVAARLRVPQYRIRSIEEGYIRQVEGDVLQQYVRYLGLANWFRRWIQANQDLAKQLLAVPPRTQP